jgi:hypothetical protein
LKLTNIINRVVDASFNVDAYKSWKNENQEPVNEQESVIEDGKNSNYTLYNLFILIS